MAKRALPSEFATSDILVEAMPAFGASSQSPRMLALPSMPGQWDTVYVPRDAIVREPASTPSYFTTFRRWVVPVCTTVTGILGGAYRLLKIHAQRQRIQPVSTSRLDGARKKILIDAGADEPTTPKKNTRASKGRGAQANGRKAKNGRVHPNNTRSSQGVVQNIPAQYRPVADDTNIRADYTPSRPMAGSYPQSPRSSPGFMSSNNTPLPMTSTPLHVHNDMSHIAGSTVGNDLEISFEDFDHSTPRPDGFYTSPRIRKPHRTVLPATRRSRAKKARLEAEHRSHLSSLGEVDRKADASLLNNTPTHPRIQALSASTPDHTNRAFQPHHPSDATAHHLYTNSASFKDNVAAVTSQAHQENEEYRTRLHNELHREKASANGSPNSPTRSLGNFSDPQQFLTSFFSDVPNKADISFEYENDLSNLPDAPTPTLKFVQIKKTGKAKSFHKEAPASDLLDSHSEIIKIILSPGKTTSDEDEYVEESTLSEEVFEEVKGQLLPTPPPTQESQMPTKTSTRPSRPPLIAGLTAEEQLKLDDAVTKTSNGAHHVSFMNNTLSTHDFKTLLPTLFEGNPKAWLNDNIVNEYLKLLINHEKSSVGYEHIKDGPAPRVHAFPSQWYTTMCRNPQNVKRWANRVQLGGKSLLDAELLLIPICDGGHWRLLSIEPQARTIRLLDSMNACPESYIKKAHEWLKNELGELYDPLDWEVKGLKESSVQLNGSDCGVFTCLNALALLRGEERHRVVADNGMMTARERIAVSLLNGKQTGELS